jgi:hypothetical protein
MNGKRGLLYIWIEPSLIVQFNVWFESQNCGESI